LGGGAEGGIESSRGGVMKIAMNYYLSFNGDCKQAMEFYQSALGGVLNVKTFRGTPMESHAGPDRLDEVLHAHLEGDGFVLMGSDIPRDRYVKPNPMTQISLILHSLPDSEALFAKLSEGGQVFMPMQKTFWAESFGMFADRYGFSWMISYEVPD
jgi:PhnB protein